jgi:two-component system, cell cycle sensor histidine kinase and response regulator CckA
LSWNIIPVLSENVLYGFGRDVTESRHLAEQFQQSQKMEAIGRLAGGVAHDFNNLLTVINGYSEMLLTDFTLDEPYRDPVAEIRRSGERAAELTSQLLAFSCRSLVAPRILNLNQIVESTGRMLRRLIGEDIQLIIRECENLPPIVGDQGKLEQVLLNLAVNSRDAMPHGGRLIIETDHVTITHGPHSDETDMSPGSYSCLRVIDTGEGMADDVRARIFEPFFTTKEVGKGTGLGLSVVHGIVSQFGGCVFVDSIQREGTTMTLYFPVAAAGEEASTPERCFMDGRGCETLLLVEDDDAVRTISLIALENAGFRVIAADSAASAITLAKPQIAEVDLLITDVVMPKMGGRELVKRSMLCELTSRFSLSAVIRRTECLRTGRG